MLINDVCSWREKEGQLCRKDSDCNWLHDKLTVPDSIRDQCQIQQTINGWRHQKKGLLFGIFDHKFKCVTYKHLLSAKPMS